MGAADSPEPAAPAVPAAKQQQQPQEQQQAGDAMAVPVYKPWRDPLATSEAFGQLESLMKARIIFIDGAMGTMIQRYKLEEEDFRGDRCADAAQGQQQQQWPATAAAAAVGPAEVFWGILPATVRVWAAASAVEK